MDTVSILPVFLKSFDGDSPVNGGVSIQSMHDLEFVFITQLSLVLQISPQVRIGWEPSIGLLNDAFLRLVQGVQNLASQGGVLRDFRLITSLLGKGFVQVPDLT